MEGLCVRFPCKRPALVKCDCVVSKILRLFPLHNIISPSGNDRTGNTFSLRAYHRADINYILW